MGAEDGPLHAGLSCWPQRHFDYEALCLAPQGVRLFEDRLARRNGAAILAVPRLNLLARPLAATKGEGFGRRALSAVSFRRSAFDDKESMLSQNKFNDALTRC